MDLWNIQETWGSIYGTTIFKISRRCRIFEAYFIAIKKED